VRVLIQFDRGPAFGLLAAGLMVLGAASPGRAAETACQVTEIAPGVKMRATNCPTLIGRPASLQPNRVDRALPQPPAGLYRYSDVEMRIAPVRTPTPGLGISPSGPSSPARRP
jgi:hypothetical protein